MTEATATATLRQERGGDQARKYAPLLAIGVAMAIVLAVLPSSLNLPQSNPTQTLEYAPVPPDDQDDTPPQGNMSSLGLGSSSGIDGDGARGGDGAGGDPLEQPEPPPDPVPPMGTDFRCVGENPPRQTEDPLSPPCVPFFDGDNGGETYQGVYPDEIRLLVYIDGGVSYIAGSNPSNQTAPSGKLYDLFVEPKDGESEHLTVTALRTWQRYFNLRFQRYNRRVHFWVWFSGERSSDGRRQDAAQNFADVKPFAVISFASEGFEDDYLKAMARKGVLNFGSFASRPAELYQGFPKMIWSYLPSVEQQAESYVNYICKKVVNKPAVLAGAPMTNQTRKLGILYTSDPKQEGLIKFGRMVIERVRACGGKIEGEARFQPCCVAQNGASPNTEASNRMAEFQRDGITTILWPGGINGDYGKAAQNIGYSPEWIIAGDTILDANYPVKLSQNSTAFHRRAIVVTPQTLQPALQNNRCYRAYREIDQSTPDTDLQYTCEYYTDLFQFMTGVQVAGPRLGPTSLDKGFRAIPQRYNGQPDIPACFYPPGDYTCVKDAQAEIWDAEKMPPGDNKPGCWQAIDGGRRYAPGAWPDGNINVGANGPITGNERCNGYDTRVRFNL